MVEKRQSQAQKRVDDRVQDLQDITNQVAENEKRQANLVRRIAAESDDTIAAMYRQELGSLVQQLKGLRVRGARAYNAAEVVSYFHSFFAETRNRLGRDNALYDMTRDEKRRLMKSLGVRVNLYSASADYSRESGKRWEFTVNAEDGEGDENGSVYLHNPLEDRTHR